MRIDRILYQHLLTGWLLFCTGPLSAKEIQGPGRTFGIIIGVADYSHLPKLQYADKDALEFYLYLQKVSPSDAKRIFVFLNKKATSGAIATKFYQIINEAQPGDRVYIYFSGHGDIEQLYQANNFFLLLGNCPRKNYMTQPDQLLEKAFFDCFIPSLMARKVRIIFICDACHAGSLIGGPVGRKNNMQAMMSSWGNEAKLLSCRPDQASQESPRWGGGRSVFSWYLVLGMKGLADKDGDQQISLSELQEYLDGNVQQETRAFDTLQQPEILGEKGFVISRTTPTLLLQAKQQWKTNGSSEEYNKLAINKGDRIQVGNNTYIFKSDEKGSNTLEPATALSITDNYWKTIYYAFRSKIEEGRLLQPGNNTAYALYQSFSQANSSAPETEDMRVSLLTAFTATYDSLLAPFYKDDTAGFAGALEAYDLNNLTIALDLAPEVLPLKNRIKAGQLLIRACRQSADAAIPLLVEAIRTDSLCPALYKRLGDVYFSSRQYSQAADNYRIYAQMLPNEESAQRKLSQALLAQKKISSF
ncbi:MAG: caspase family protein [Chitinophagaceae bacterium]|nr:caspase family protein [Chitinophagaceae bacterium]